MAKYKWWKVIDAKTRTHPGDKSGKEFVLVVTHDGVRKEITVSAGSWSEACEKGGIAL